MAYARHYIGTFHDSWLQAQVSAQSKQTRTHQTHTYGRTVMALRLTRQRTRPIRLAVRIAPAAPHRAADFGSVPCYTALSGTLLRPDVKNAGKSGGISH